MTEGLVATALDEVVETDGQGWRSASGNHLQCCRFGFSQHRCHAGPGAIADQFDSVQDLLPFCEETPESFAFRRLYHSDMMWSFLAPLLELLDCSWSWACFRCYMPAY